MLDILQKSEAGGQMSKLRPDPSIFSVQYELLVMKNKLIAFALLVLATILISGCATSTETTTTTRTREQSSMYAR